MTQLSKHFSELEFTRSATAQRLGIQNDFPSNEVKENAIRLCVQFLEPLRENINHVFKVTSGYRGVALNKAIGGSKVSAHCDGRAVDFTIDGLSVKLAFNLILDYLENLKLDWDQLIFEGTWIHLGIAKKGQKGRKQILQAIFTSGKPTQYINITGV
jgi:zinc D-Ala-D-Ala carboxypeptidase